MCTIHPLSIYVRAMAVVFLLGLTACTGGHLRLSPSVNDLVFNDLAKSWDEAMPLGNALVGELVWQKDSALRLSLDHVGLWDLRPAPHSDSLNVYNFKWIEAQVQKKDYAPVQQRYDAPYNTSAFPSKIPGGAIEFSLSPLGKTDSIRLYLNNALCEAHWDSDVRLQTFVHATKNVGWFRFSHVPPDFKPVLVPPTYQKAGGVSGSMDHGSADIARLGYPQGRVEETATTLYYHQPGSDGFFYEITVAYRRSGHTLEGVWTVMSKEEVEQHPEGSVKWAEDQLKEGFAAAFETHDAWWRQYWKQSSVEIPDPVLAKQYHNEMYKFGSAARSYSPPVSLQAVWTADNGYLPPWKGDYHHDLNTQLSYWLCYAGNHLEEGLGYLNWLWETMPAAKRYTENYFGVNGLAVPGVTTLEGEPMFGWIQYSMGPTVSAWLAQHFYLHWQYSQDMDFLKQSAYPYIKEVALFLDELAVRDKDGKRRLPISSSPEIYNNSLEAWFHTTTNFDLGLIRFVYTAAEELAGVLELPEDTERWHTILSEWPFYDLDDTGGLTFAKGFPYNESHRHFSHAMAIHPLGLIDVSHGEKEQKIVEATLGNLDRYGPSLWCGYSYSWLGNLKARALDGDGAAQALKIFAEHFCLRNTFHANGDQTKSGYSDFTYRPFTLEGNMAFASGIHEMLMQSHTGVIRLFPAIPASWKDVSFSDLRAMGAFLVSAVMENGKVTRITIRAEKGGELKLAVPEGYIQTSPDWEIALPQNGLLTKKMTPGEILDLKILSKF
ncbi:MAG: hypothetical protein LBR26_03340 [Prevotella sp.]|jgi:hypothetical protein|nr:hypothetical protein [Prevotella sp.]